MFCCSVVNELIHWKIAQLIQKRVGIQPTEVVVHLASVHDSIFKRFTVMKFPSTAKKSLHTEGVKGLDLHVNLCWGSYAWHNFHSTLSTQEYKMVLVRMCACVCGVGGGREVELGEGSGGCNVIPSWLILHQVKESSTDSMGLSFYSWHM